MTLNNESLGNETEKGIETLIFEEKVIKTNKKFVCKIYKVFNDIDYIFVNTKQRDIKKYLHKVKTTNNKRNVKLVEILKTNYNTEFIETFEYSCKDELNNKLTEINKRVNSKELDLKYGLSEEDKVLIKIQNFFTNDEILKATYKYSTFDFIGLKSQYLYELKCNRDKFNDYPNAIIGTNKIIKGIKQIFLFQFTTDTPETELYYFIKPNDFETTYHKRQIFLRARNIYNWVYDIPREELIKITKNTILTLEIDLTDNELFKHFYELDKVRADIETY